MILKMELQKKYLNKKVLIEVSATTINVLFDV